MAADRYIDVCPNLIFAVQDDVKNACRKLRKGDPAESEPQASRYPKSGRSRRPTPRMRCPLSFTSASHALSQPQIHVLQEAIARILPSGLRVKRSASRLSRVGMVCLWVLLGWAKVWASEPAFQVTNWQTQEGLPSNKIGAVLQTQDGYIWIGTYEGLIRFDGVKFTLFDSTKVPEWRDSGVTALYESPDGALWIGHSNGAVSALRRGVFTVFPPHKEWKGGKIQGIGRDNVGDIWVFDNGGTLSRLRDGFLLKPEAGTALGLAEMTCSAERRIWVTVGGCLSELRDGRLQVVPLLEPMATYVHGVCAAKDGGLWVAAHGHLWKRVEGEWGVDLGKLAFGFAPVHTFVEASNGWLIAGTSDHGAFFISPASRAKDCQLGRATGFATDWVAAACEDHEGGIWLGGGSSGLFRLREKNVTMLAPADAWQGRAVLTVTPSRDGGLWVGTEGAGLYRLRDENWNHYGIEAGLRNQYVWSVHEGPDAVWAGTWFGLSMQAGERFVPAPGTDEFWTPVTAMLAARDGGLWVGSRLGLLHYQQGTVRWVEPVAERKLREVRAIAEQADGTLWAGCNGDGLGQVRGGKVRQYRRQDGLASDFIQCLHVDEDGALWIGTRGGGLNRFKDGRFSVVSVANGLVNGSICHLEDDGLGYYWISSRGGIMRVNKRELNDCADGRLRQLDCLSYGLSDGLLTLACSGALQPAGCRMADGRLVFATDRGPAVIDPRNVRPNTHAPPVSIESLRVGDRVVADGAFPAEPIEIGPGESRIEIKYTGLSFAAPEKVHFKRRLEGLEEEWVAVGSERLAVYNYVPPGRYVFRVTAANNDNVWNPQGRSLTIVVLPHFWQTLWFKGLLLAALLLATGGVVWVQARRRLKHRLETLERERAIDAERTRIANDMHDDLGSQLTRITMLSETARADTNDRARIEAGLSQIYDTARNVTRAMDEIVWAVNPKHDTLESLVSYFEKFAQDLLGVAGIRCRLDLPVEFPAWGPSSEVRHNLFLAYKEALNNAVRHSGADTVTVSLTMNPEGCRLTVSDNGRGLGGIALADRAPVEGGRASAGNGFPNMRRRMTRIGGTCEITTAPGAGYTVSFFVPVPSLGQAR